MQPARIAGTSTVERLAINAAANPGRTRFVLVALFATLAGIAVFHSTALSEASGLSFGQAYPFKS